MEKQKDQVTIFEFKEGFEYLHGDTCYRRVGDEVQYMLRGNWKEAIFSCGIPKTFKIITEKLPSNCQFCTNGKNQNFLEEASTCDFCNGTANFIKEKYTCNTCDFIACPVRWDCYNINGECLYK